jgi:protein phosphatase-4 regulatory subunit 3
MDVPPSPRLAHRQISRPSSIPRRRTHEEDDNILESLLRQKGSPSSPSLSEPPTKLNLKSSQLPPIRLSEKRRRENDEDELLERLASKSKRADLGTQKRDEPVGGRAAAMKPGDDPPRRMKVMFRPLGMTVAQSTSPVPPDPGPKDRDTG